ncbi:hypothetical protein ACGFNU_00310 [Spirillospora sp. NPDC048911]|uniref:hypothetical protein n=1 Tax=Spirillospora sp. NPDC048911 TaxID=3364527 RepID=UPI003720A6BF
MRAGTGEWTLPSVVSRSDLGAVDGSISPAAGQSSGIHPLRSDPGWLVKLYKAPLDAAETQRLDTLVALPGALAETQRSLLREQTSWPVARVTGPDGLALGCVLPTAPDRFRVQTGNGNGTPAPNGNGPAGSRFQEIDFLASPAAAFQRRGMRAPTSEDRWRVCRNLANVAAVLEQHRLVYSDWSYSNAFWSGQDQTVFLIDVDGCGIGSMPNIHQPNWEDPLTPANAPADAATDRYRVALLTARCLTGRRDLASVLHTLADTPDDVPAYRVFAEVLLDALLAEHRTRRPRVEILAQVLNGGPYIRFKPARLPLPARPGPQRQGTVTGTFDQRVLIGAAATPAAPKPQRSQPPTPPPSPGDHHTAHGDWQWLVVTAIVLVAALALAVLLVQGS